MPPFPAPRMARSADAKRVSFGLGRDGGTVDAVVSNTTRATCEGSNPSPGTKGYSGCAAVSTETSSARSRANTQSARVCVTGLAAFRWTETGVLIVSARYPQAGSKAMRTDTLP